MTHYREERDTMGTMLVPVSAYYGSQTQRAVENFPISGLRFPPPFIRALGMIKKHAAWVNRELELLDLGLAEAVATAAEEVAAGKWDDQFVVDIFQTGSGTSTNMNANEVIAGRSNEVLTGKRGGRTPVHPNDHVNLGQSSNDVIPSAIHIAALTEIRNRLLPSMTALENALQEKAQAFHNIRKIGRTHLQDAVPMSLGQEFGGYARQIHQGIDRVRRTEASLSELALGGTAVGTGLNTHPDFARKVIAALSEDTGCPFVEARDHFEAQAAQDGAVETSGALKAVAVSLIKMANDLRWLSSGPRCGLGEITLPSLQPGSSIMPGKVNPVIPEMVVQVGAQVIGNDSVIAISGQAGNFELMTMLPVIAYNLLQSIFLLGNAAAAFAEKCVQGISANKEKAAFYVEQSLALGTAFAPSIGYDQASALVKEAHTAGKTIREVALEKRVLPEKEIHRILDEVVEGRKGP